MDSKNKVGHDGKLVNGLVKFLGSLVSVEHGHEGFGELDHPGIKLEDVNKEFADLQVHHLNLSNYLERGCHYFIYQHQELCADRC